MDITYNIESKKILNIGRQFDHKVNTITFEGFTPIKDNSDIFIKFEGLGLYPLDSELSFSVIQPFTMKSGKHYAQLLEVAEEKEVIQNSPMFIMFVEESIDEESEIVPHTQEFDFWYTDMKNLYEEILGKLERGELKGEDGYTPIKGIDYFDGAPGKDGKDYQITEKDYQDIAKIVEEEIDLSEIEGKISSLEDNKMQYAILVFDGSKFFLDGVEKTFLEIRDLCLNKKDFVYAQYQNRLYIPQYVSETNIFFEASYPDSDVPQMHRIGINSSNQVSKYDYNLAKIADVNKKQDKLTAGDNITIEGNKISATSSGGSSVTMIDNEDGGVDLTVDDVTRTLVNDVQLGETETRLRSGYFSEPNGYNNFARNLETGELYAYNGYYTTKLIPLPTNIDLRIVITSNVNYQNRIILLDKDKNVLRTANPMTSTQWSTINSNEVYCYVTVKDLPSQDKDLVFMRTTGGTAEQVIFTVDNGSHIDGLIDKADKIDTETRLSALESELLGLNDIIGSGVFE